LVGKELRRRHSKNFCGEWRAVCRMPTLPRVISSASLSFNLGVPLMAIICYKKVAIIVCPLEIIWLRVNKSRSVATVQNLAYSATGLLCALFFGTAYLIVTLPLLTFSFTCSKWRYSSLLTFSGGLRASKGAGVAVTALWNPSCMSFEFSRAPL
jgi:hypothetical protein